MPLAKRIAGGHTSLGAQPRSYQVTPEILGRRTGDTTGDGQTHRSTPSLKSQPAADPGPNPSDRTPPPGNADNDSERSLRAGAYTRNSVGPRACQGRYRHRDEGGRARARVRAADGQLGAPEGGEGRRRRRARGAAART